jgi:hypothetical protein
MHYERWTDVSGIRLLTQRANYLSGVKRGEATTEVIHLNAGLQAQALATHLSTSHPP